MACTTWMPSVTVRAPAPPTFVTFSVLVPLAAPPLTISLSDGAPSPANVVFNAIVAFWPT